MVQKYEGAITLLRTIPGVDRSSAITILSEIGIDMAQFGSSKRLCCWAGLTLVTTSPQERKNLSVFHVLEFISNQRWCRLHTLP